MLGRSSGSTSTPTRSSHHHRHHEAEATRVAQILRDASEVLLVSLFSYLSKLPEEDSGRVASQGLTLPAGAVGWLASQLYPEPWVVVDYEENDESSHSKNSNQDDNITISSKDPASVVTATEEQQPTFCLGRSIRDRLSLLRFLLPRATHVRITTAEWPPMPSKKQQQAVQCNHHHPTSPGSPRRRFGWFSSRRATTADQQPEPLSISWGEDCDPKLFLQYVSKLHRRLDLRVFPNCHALLLDKVAPSWIVNLPCLQQNLQVLRVERGCFYSVEKFLVRKSRDEDNRHHEIITEYALLQEEKQDSRQVEYPKVSHLRLSNCGLDEMSGLNKQHKSGQGRYPMTRFPNLKSLSLSHNHIRRLTTALAGLSSLSLLEKLDLSYNQLTSLEPIRYRVGQIRVLILSGNRIASVRGLETLVGLQQVRLDHNFIADLAQVAPLAGLPELTHVWLHDNPIHLSDEDNRYRFQVLELFRQARTERLLPQERITTYRHLLAMLPILDDAPATVQELVALKERTFVTRVKPNAAAFAATANMVTTTTTRDDFDDEEHHHCREHRRNHRHHHHHRHHHYEDNNVDDDCEVSSLPRTVLVVPETESIMTAPSSLGSPLQHRRRRRRRRHSIGATRAAVIDETSIAQQEAKAHSQAGNLLRQQQQQSMPTLMSHKEEPVVPVAFSIHDVVSSLTPNKPPPVKEEEGEEEEAAVVAVTEYQERNDDNNEAEEEKKMEYPPLSSPKEMQSPKRSAEMTQEATPVEGKQDNTKIASDPDSPKEQELKEQEKPQGDKPAGGCGVTIPLKKDKLKNPFAFIMMGKSDRSLKDTASVTSASKKKQKDNSKKEIRSPSSPSKLTITTPSPFASMQDQQLEEFMSGFVPNQHRPASISNGSAANFLNSESLFGNTENNIFGSLNTSTWDTFGDTTTSPESNKSTLKSPGSPNKLPQADFLSDNGSYSNHRHHNHRRISSNASSSVDCGDSRMQPSLSTFPEHIWQDDLSVPSSLGASAKEDLIPRMSAFLQAEKRTKYNGPETYRSFSVHENMELYFQLFVFAAASVASIPSSIPKLPRNISQGGSEEEDGFGSLSITDFRPRIQLWPVDRKQKEIQQHVLASTTAGMDTIMMEEQLRHVWKDRVIACGQPAARRLFPHRASRLGFHGEVTWDNQVGQSRPHVTVRSRPVILCLTNMAFYVIRDYEEDDKKPDKKMNPDRSEDNILLDPALKKNLPFPLSIPHDSCFGDARFPHAVARHALHTLSGITIGFSFQRLTLRFANATYPSTDDFTYVLLTCDKQETVTLLQKIQELAKDAKVMTGMTPLSLADECVPIENDDRQVLDALATALKEDSVGTILHYQIVQQRWKHGDRGTVRRVCMVTDSKLYLLDEDYNGDGSDSLRPVDGRRTGDVRYRWVDSADLIQVSQVQAADADPKAITVEIRPLSPLARMHRWRLLFRNAQGAERLVEDVRKAMALGLGM